MNHSHPEISPDNTVFALLSFEGPDRYALAGGLGTRVTEFSEALATAGYETHLLFIGAPDAPASEQRGANLCLWRVCRELAEKYPTGVYQGEEEKLAAYEHSVPTMLLEQIGRRAWAQGKLLVVCAEDWHTAATISSVADIFDWQAKRAHAILLWNANSIFGYERINWPRLAGTTTITAVSRYMKQLMTRQKVRPLVIPNGIPERALDPVALESVYAFQRVVPNRLLLPKIARFDPDKGWLPAVQAVARLRDKGRQPLFFMRGGVEGYGLKVLNEISNLGLRRRDLQLDNPTLEACIQAVAEVQGEADVITFRFFVPEDFQRVLYRASHAVLANSVHEPFGLVGLEVMAAQGIAFVGGTGEEYASHMVNAVSLDTDNPDEIVSNMLYLEQHPDLVAEMRHYAYKTAKLYTWDRVIDKLVSKLHYLTMKGGILWPQ